MASPRKLSPPSIPRPREVKRSPEKLEPVRAPKLRPPARPSRPPPSDAPEPAVLLVGADDAFVPALQAALARHKVFVETSEADDVVEAVIAAAPDLVMLMGAAAHDCGSAILTRLSASPQSSVVPVVILDDNTQLDARLRAFRHGAAAIIPRSASVDAIADQVAKLAKDIPDRERRSLGVVGEATLEELVQTLGKELRSGILSVSAAGSDQNEAVRLVLGGGRPLAELIDDFVRRARKHIVRAEPLRYEFDERAGGTVQLLGSDPPPADELTADAAGLRLALADDDAARTDAVAQQLRNHGAVVVVTDLNPNPQRFERLRQLDPALLLIGEEQARQSGFGLLERMREDRRLRWASLLIVRWDELLADGSEANATARLGPTLQALSETERALTERARTDSSFDARLESTGPARCLRALAAADTTLRVTIENPRLKLIVDLSDGLVVGAVGKVLSDEREVASVSALAALLQVSSGRVHVERVLQPSTANLMSPVDVALNMADSEPPPIAPSIPAAPFSDPPAVAVPTAAPLPRLAPAGAELARAGDLAVATLRRWFKPASGINLPWSVVLVGLGALQGLVFAYWLSTWGSPDPAPTPAASAAAAEPTPKPRRSEPKSAAAPFPLASQQTALAAPASATSAPPASEQQPTPDVTPASGEALPSCEDLLNEEYQHAKSRPGVAYKHVAQANRSLVRGDLLKAHEQACRAVSWAPDETEPLVVLAHVLLIRRDGAGARQWAERALRINPEHPRGEGVLVDALNLVGQGERARQLLIERIHKTSADRDNLERLARRYVKTGREALHGRRFGDAERAFRRAQSLDSANAEADMGLAEALAGLDVLDEALLWAERARARIPESPAVLTSLGIVREARGETELARRAYTEALTRDPGHYSARKALLRLDDGP